jgi:tetratricopeptide (TPR) repeat protein
MNQRLLIGATVAVVSFVLANSAHAAVTIVGRGPAADCYRAAAGERADWRALEVCNLAIEGQFMTTPDRAATLVNRAIIRMRRSDNTRALNDLDDAIALDAQLAEAHVIRGAVLIDLGRPQEAVAGLTQALALNPANPERIYYYRAAAYEDQGDNRAAYEDYRRAVESAPDWAPPRHELSRFRVG